MHNRPNAAAVACWTVFMAGCGTRGTPAGPDAATAAAPAPSVAERLRFVVRDGKLRGESPRGFSAELDAGGLRVAAPDEPAAELGMALTGYGRAGALLPPPVAEPVAEDAKATYDRDGLLEESYDNLEAGIEQTLVLHAPPPVSTHGRARAGVVRHRPGAGAA